MRWIKYILYKTGNWLPTRVNDKMHILIKNKINIYERSSKVIVSTNNIMQSMMLIEELLIPDYDNEYVLKTNHVPLVEKEIFIHHWYSDSGSMLDVDVFVNWLIIFEKLNKKYEKGMRAISTSLAYRNSVKIKFIIDEGTSVVNAVFK